LTFYWFIMFKKLKKLWRSLKGPRPADGAAVGRTAPPAGGPEAPAAAHKPDRPAPDGPHRPVAERNDSGRPGRRRGSPPAAAAAKAAHPLQSAQQPSPPVNRHGLPILKDDEDLALLFSREDGGPQMPLGGRHHALEARRPPALDAAAANAAKESPPGAPPLRRDRHGLPLLAPEADLETLFGGQPDPAAPARTRFSPAAPPFARLVQRSLGERDLQQLLEEKIRRERRAVQSVSIRQQIKAHPPPQRQLDLHGCTALQAQQRTEAFVHGALHAGLATVRIIVGRGLHSPGRAVLPDAVAEKLAELKGRGKVLTFQWEKHKKSKSGALIVYL
jgi:DNA-nicking Smr family endonuclease